MRLQADRALKIFHSEAAEDTAGIPCGSNRTISKQTRKLIAPLPWGIDAERGGVRIFYERWGDDLFREALAYLPQRAVTDNTKAAGIRIKTTIQRSEDYS